MIKELSFSEFPINGIDVDDYCYLFFDTYGDGSQVCRAIEKEYSKSKSKDGTWVSFWNELRKNLCNDGFEKEVTEQDRVFIEKMKKELSKINEYSGKTISEMRKSYIPLSERMKSE